MNLDHGLIARNWEAYSELVERADHDLERGRAELASAMLQVAATLAWANHPGAFADTRFEEVLGRLDSGAATPTRPSRSLPSSSRSRRVLHVATRTYDVGGHTRLIQHWISADPDSAHALVLTDQGSILPPAALLEACRAANVSILTLNEEGPSVLKRSIALRALLDWASLIVLHVHPNDLVPPLALNNCPCKPVIYLNHAEMAFWPRPAQTCIVAGVNRRSCRLTYERRGFDETQTCVLPIPLAPNVRWVSREVAKGQVGIPPEAVLLLCMASGGKFIPLDGCEFTRLHARILEANPSAWLIVLGPLGSDSWNRVQRLGHDRLRLVGSVPNPALYLQACDIFVDSFILGSSTSMLETASYGNPALRFRPPSLGGSIAAPDEPCGSICQSMDSQDYVEQVSRLIADKKARLALGEATVAAIGSVHGRTAWSESLEAAYNRAARCEGVSLRPAGAIAPNRDDAAAVACQIQENGSGDDPVTQAIAWHMSRVPVTIRGRLFARHPFWNGMPTLKLMLSEQRRSQCGQLRRALMSVARSSLRASDASRQQGSVCAGAASSLISSHAGEERMTPPNLAAVERSICDADSNS